ncbi:hypothetical protein B0T13DRAFT_505683 [Neurospora crassa]|nr:hypothetical protein B0T13DRAFT_505683 [Neurospora crassa]
MSLTLDIPPEDVDRLLDERGRSPNAEDNRLWLLCRRHHLFKKFETDDGQFDSDGFAKALSEVMAGDRGDKDVPNLSRHEQHHLRDDRGQERRLARERILKLTSQEMEEGLRKQFVADFSPFGSHKFSYDDLIYTEDFKYLAKIVGTAADRIRECCKGAKDQEDHLKSLGRLVRDLGKAIADCDSIQDYLSFSNLLFWSAKDVLNLTTDPSMPKITGVGVLKSIVRDLFINYVASVLLVELKAKVLSTRLAGLELGMTSGEFDKIHKGRLELENIAINPDRVSQLLPKSSTYLTPEGKPIIESFANVIAKMMVVDTRGPLPLLKEVLDFESEYYNRMNSTHQVHALVYSRRFLQQQEGEWKIRDEMEASTIMERLVGDRLILSIIDRAKIVSDDLLSPKSINKMTEELAVLIREQLLTEETKIVGTQPNDGEVHARLTEVRPFIIDLGGFVKSCKDFETYLTASLFLFLATVDTWLSLPASDSCRKAREYIRSTAEKFLRNYMALVLICEAKAAAQRLEAAAQRLEELKANEAEAEQPKGEQPKAEGSGAGESASGDSEPVKKLSVTYDIPRESFSKPCCVLL